MNINWNSVPTFTIDIKNIDVPYDIVDIFSGKDPRYFSHQIDGYLYAIKHNDIIVKIGKSFDMNSSPGDRVYRQIGHASFWGHKRIDGPNGRDFIRDEEDFYKKYGTYFQKDKMTVEVWDFTNYSYQTVTPDKEIGYAEEYLINKYSEVTKSDPVGNRKKNKRYDRKGFIMKTPYEKIFEDDNVKPKRPHTKNNTAIDEDSFNKNFKIIKPKGPQSLLSP